MSGRVEPEPGYLPPAVVRVDLNERRAREWAVTAREMGHKVRVHKRTASAEGIAIMVWVCVADIRKGDASLLVSK